MREQFSQEGCCRIPNSESMEKLSRGKEGLCEIAPNHKENWRKEGKSGEKDTKDDCSDKV